MIRAFVGLGLPDAVSAWLLRAQAGLTVGRPVAREAFHITLAFLDSQAEPVLEELHYELERVARRAAPMELQIDGLAAFGGDRPRSLYAAVRAGRPLKELRKAVQTAARDIGIDLPRERFVPHITLARFSRAAPPETALALSAFLSDRGGLSTGPFPVESVSLYRSHLRADGAAYTELARYPLGSGP